MWQPYWRTVTLADGRRVVVSRDEDEATVRALSMPRPVRTEPDGLSDAEIAALNMQADRETRERARDEQDEAEWLDRAH